MNTQKLKGKMIEKGFTPKSLAEKVGIDRSSMYRKLNSVGKFTIGEAKAIKTILELTDSEASAIFFD